MPAVLERNAIKSSEVHIEQIKKPLFLPLLLGGFRLFFQRLLGFFHFNFLLSPHFDGNDQREGGYKRIQ